MIYRYLLLVVMASLIGCGGGGAARSTIPVSGKVTMDGKPIETGTVLFEPSDGKGASASAKINAGNFETRIEPGVKIVRINYPKVVRTEPAYPGSANSPMIDITEEQIPAKYNSLSQLEKDLTEPKGPVNFELTSK